MPYPANQTPDDSLILRMRRLQIAQSAATRTSPLPTWRQLKHLTFAVEQTVASSGKPKTPENLFLALLALLSVQVILASTVGIQGDS